MKNDCLVSVIVPVCNVQRYLRQCLDSLTDQTLQEIQIICIDDGSTDDSLIILKEYAEWDSRIEVISKPNAGYGHTMNQGLAAARGEYVGIVESDDFADPDMFEKLYQIAKEYDVDVVKSNFYQYLTNTVPDNDPIVDNLAACPIGKVFCPLEHQDIFLTQPAIWSALYKREFLQREGIAFLETPGASFQDTSFNFKVFASAQRAILTQDAYLHYRIDNSNSSVKSLSKVFCICDEYREIWEFARSRERIYSALKYRIPQIQFGGYLWNLDRLTPSLQHQFYQQFVSEFLNFKERDLLQKSFFDDVAWEKLQGIVSDSKGYYEQHYGPIEVERTILLSVEENARQSCERLVSGLLELMGTSDELFLYSRQASIESRSGVRRLLDSDPRFHLCEGEIESSVVEEINISSIRGTKFTVVKIGGPGWNPKLTAKVLKDCMASFRDESIYVNNAWAVASWGASDLVNITLPLWLPLLYSSFYECLEGNAKLTDLPKWLLYCGTSGSDVALREYLHAYESLKSLCKAVYEESASEQLLSLHGVLTLLWNRIQDAYHSLPYDDREHCDRPSPNDFQALNIASGAAGEDIDVSVIIPVYNSSDYLSGCLGSVLSQSKSNIQVICIDDGSTDNSLELLGELAASDDRVTVVSQFNGGAGAARNRGIGLARGKYLAFIDPDDVYPNDQVLEKLFFAAENSGELLSGGSFEMFYPDGKEKKVFGGEQRFYTVRKEGVQSLSGFQTDYGWIRFLYHREIFDKGNIRFPEYRWYEDPVFLVRVMSYHDTFFGITEPVYRYRVDYKEASWNCVKVRDMVKGIRHDLEFAREHKLSGMYTVLILRLNRDYYPAIMEFIRDEEVFTELAKIQGSLDVSLMNDAVDNNWNTYLIKPFFDFIGMNKTAVVRLAEQVEDSAFYRRLQKARMKAHGE